MGGMLPPTKITVPTGCSNFERQFDQRGAVAAPDIATRRAAASTRYPVVHFAVSPQGGHFPAAEQPRLWIEDFRAFLSALGP